MKYNQKGYKFYVVVDGKIESGWEYKDDAKEQQGEISERSKIYQSAGLKSLGLDPNDNNDWKTGKMATELVKIAMKREQVAARLVKLAKELSARDDELAAKMIRNGDGMVDLLEGKVKKLRNEVRDMQNNLKGLERAGGGEIDASLILAKSDAIKTLASIKGFCEAAIEQARKTIR